MKALIAESNREESDHIVIALNICLPNFELIIADTGKQCLDMVKDNSLDIVILGDLVDMSGIDVIKQIRDCSEVPVTFLSNTNDESLVLKAFSSGADDYMTKPFHHLELVARLKAILKSRQALSNIQDNVREEMINRRAGPAGGNQGAEVGSEPSA